MTDRDQIIAWARECTAPEWWDEPATGWHMGMDLVRFASIAQAHESEQCARVCEEARSRIFPFHDKPVLDAANNVAVNIAAAIRGRAEK